MSADAFFVLSVVVLAALLFLPTTRLVWIFSVRRLERREHRTLDEAERHGQLNRARLVASVIALLFSFMFNAAMLGVPGHG